MKRTGPSFQEALRILREAHKKHGYIECRPGVWILPGDPVPPPMPTERRVRAAFRPALPKIDS